MSKFGVVDMRSAMWRNGCLVDHGDAEWFPTVSKVREWRDMGADRRGPGWGLVVAPDEFEGAWWVGYLTELAEAVGDDRVEALFFEGCAWVNAAERCWREANDPERAEDFRRVSRHTYELFAARARTRFRRHDVLLDLGQRTRAHADRAATVEYLVGVVSRGDADARTEAELTEARRVAVRSARRQIPEDTPVPPGRASLDSILTSVAWLRERSDEALDAVARDLSDLDDRLGSVRDAIDEEG